MTTKDVAVTKNVLIFSDTHLTHRFDQVKFDYLKKLIEEADLVVINGDFWDYYLTSWDEFLKSKWKRLFPLLKARNAIYVYGNHDQQIHSDQRVNLFSVEQGYEFRLKIGKLVLNIQHGHLIVPTLEVKFARLRKKLLIRLASKLEESNIFLFTQRVMNHVAAKQNHQMKAFLERSIPDGEYLICGHTHLRENETTCRFINTGWIRYGQAQALQIRNGIFTVVDTKY